MIHNQTTEDRVGLKERLLGPVQWGYMCLADGGFISDNAPVEAATRIAKLEEALREARWYVNDSLEADEHSEGRDLLARLDTLLQQDQPS